MMTSPATSDAAAAALTASLSAASPSLADQVATWLAFRGLDPDEWVELQAWDVPERNGHTVTKVTHADSAETMTKRLQEAERFGAPGIYAMANRIHEAVATRVAAGRWHDAKKGKSTTDRDITHRRVLFIDVDYERPTDTAATNAQVEEAHAVAAGVYDHLARLLPAGADSIAFGHSGNGRSLFLALDCLPESAELAALVKGVLAALKERHETDTIKIDPSVSEAKRLSPAFGTTKRKGSGEGNRPHRRTVLVAPANPRRLSFVEVGDLLTALRRGLGVDAAARIDKAMGVRAVTAARQATSTVPGRAYEQIYREAKEIPIAGVLAWLGLLQGQDPVCPGCGKSGNSSVAIVENGLKCLHKTCADKGVPGREGFRTVIDLVCEVNGIEHREAVNALADRFGTPALPEPPEARVYHLPAPARPPPTLSAPAGQAPDLAALLAQLRALPSEHRAAAALDPVLINAAAALPDTSPAFAQLRADVKVAGGVMGTWDKAVKLARPPVVASPSPPAVARPSPPSGEEWRSLLAESRGGLRQSYGNLVLILRHAPPYAGRLTYNEMRLTPCLDGRALGAADVGVLREQLERDHGLEMSADNIKQAVCQVAEERRFHPVREYLSGLAWDGTPRIDDVARLILGIAPPPENEDAEPPPPPPEDAPPTPYALAVRMIKAWFVSAVARAMRPGCKVDTALVLNGPQGYLKSTFFTVLGGPFFSDTTMTDISNKDSLMQLHAAWIYEWGEIENITTRRHSAEVKGFVTSPSDNFRAPYASAITINPRTTVIVGSTNENQFLSDPTGSRRFHVLKITSRINVALLRQWRDQLWAEAVALFGSGYQWWLEDREETVREEEAKGYQTDDATVDAVRRWLAGEEARALVTRHGYVLAADVLLLCLKLEAGRWGRPEQTRVGLAMAEIGWTKERPRIGKERVWVYKPPPAPKTC